MNHEEKPVPDEMTSRNSPDRRDERGDAAEPDAPTSGEENEAMSTILSGEPFVGVQPDEGDE
jgi:hypothetical protein